MFCVLRDPCRRAAVVVQVAVVVPLLIGFSAMTVDVGTIYNAKSDMQSASDSAALAAIAEFAYAGASVDAFAAATQAASDFAEANPVLTRVLTVDPNEDVVFGRAYFDTVANTYNFVPGDAPTNAVRVSIRHDEDSPNGPLPLYFAGIFGKSMTDVRASSIALFVRTCHEQGDCYDVPTAGQSVMCNYGDSDDSDDSQGEFGEPDSDDSDDSDSYSGNSSDSESVDSQADSDSGHTIIVDTNAVPLYLARGDALGPCSYCPIGDSDDSDDSQGEFGPPDSSDSDDSDPGDSDGSVNGDSDDSDDSQGEFGPPDSDDSDDSVASDSTDSGGEVADSDEAASDGSPAEDGALNCTGPIRIFLIQ